MELGVERPFRILKDGMVMMGRQMYLPEEKTLKEEVLREAHESRFVVHPRNTQMYIDLNFFYWWPNIKKEIAKFVAKCGIFQ